MKQFNNLESVNMFYVPGFSRFGHSEDEGGDSEDNPGRTDNGSMGRGSVLVDPPLFHETSKLQT